MWTIFAYISEMFRLVWLYSFGRFFSQKWSVDSQPSDIEAGVLCTPVVVTPVMVTPVMVQVSAPVPAIAPIDHRTVDLGVEDVEDANIESIPNPFLDNYVSYPSQPTFDDELVCPVRRPSRRHSMIVPLKSRIVDVTCKNIQDVSLEKMRSVTVTCPTVVAVACSAEVEYFEEHVASTATVEWFEPAVHQASYVEEFVYSGNHTPCSAVVEYFDSDSAAETVEETGSFTGSLGSSGFSSVDVSSMETGYCLPLVESGSHGQTGTVAQIGARDCATGNYFAPSVPLPQMPTALSFAEDVEAETSSGPSAFAVATPSLDSVAGRVPIQSGLKYSHHRYSTCDSESSTLDIDVHPSTQPPSRVRIHNGIKYSHRRYSAWTSSSSGSCSLSEVSVSIHPSAARFSGSHEDHTPSHFVLDGKDFVEDSAEQWSSQCVSAMDAAAGAEPSAISVERAVAETREDRIKRISREYGERVDSIQAQMEALFEAAYKKAGVPWVPTKELQKSLQSA